MGHCKSPFFIFILPALTHQSEQGLYLQDIEQTTQHICNRWLPPLKWICVKGTISLNILKVFKIVQLCSLLQVFPYRFEQTVKALHEYFTFLFLHFFFFCKSQHSQGGQQKGNWKSLLYWWLILRIKSTLKQKWTV